MLYFMMFCTRFGMANKLITSFQFMEKFGISVMETKSVVKTKIVFVFYSHERI